MKTIVDIHKIIKEKVYSPSCIDIDEEYRIVTYPGIRKNRYLVSDLGNIISLKTMTLMKFKYDDYLRISLATDSPNNLSESTTVSVHRLVAWEFCDGYCEKTGKIIVNHKNMCKYDNRAINLEWCDYSYNIEHAYLNSKKYYHKRFYNKEIALLIIKLSSEGKSPSDIVQFLKSKNIKISYDAIINIRSKDYYKDIKDTIDFKIPNKKVRKFNDDIISMICKYLEDGLSSIEIYRKMSSEGLIDASEKNYRTVRKIKSREAYIDISSKYNF